MSNIRVRLSLFLNYFVFAILLNSVGPVILQVRDNFGVSEGDASVLEGFKDISIAVASFAIASYVVRIGYRRTMLIALAIVSIMCLIMPSTSSFVMIKLLFASVGVGFAMIKVTVFATLGLVTNGEKQHLSLMNFLESFFMVGILAGSFLFGFFVNNEDPRSTEWLNVYYVLGGLSLLAFFLLLITPIDESTVRECSGETKATDLVGMLRLIVLPLVGVFIFSAFFYVLIEQSIMSWLPTFNKDVLHLSKSLAIQMGAVLSASFAVGRFLAGVFLRKFDWLPVLVCCLILAGAIVLLTVPMADGLSITTVETFRDLPFVAFAFPMIGLFLAPIYPAINSVILSNLPKAKHAAMAGLIVVFSALGGTTGSIITGHVFEHFGGKSAFYFSLIPMAILLLLLFGFKRLQTRTGKAMARQSGGAAAE